MQPQNPDYRTAVEEDVFKSAHFISDLGIVLSDIGPGFCKTVLEVLPRHQQHTNFTHAGVQATMADHTSGGAAATLVKAGETVLAVEFKINFLRPAVGSKLRCEAQVLKPGKRMTVVEACVFSIQDGEETLVSKALETVAVVSKSQSRRV